MKIIYAILFLVLMTGCQTIPIQNKESYNLLEQNKELYKLLEHQIIPQEYGVEYINYHARNGYSNTEQKFEVNNEQIKLFSGTELTNTGYDYYRYKDENTDKSLLFSHCNDFFESLNNTRACCKHNEKTQLNEKTDVEQCYVAEYELIEGRKLESKEIFTITNLLKYIKEEIPRRSLSNTTKITKTNDCFQIMTDYGSSLPRLYSYQELCFEQNRLINYTETVISSYELNSSWKIIPLPVDVIQIPLKYQDYEERCWNYDTFKFCGNKENFIRFNYTSTPTGSIITLEQQ